MNRHIVIIIRVGLLCFLGFCCCFWLPNPWVAQSLFSGECDSTARGVPWPVYTYVCGSVGHEDWHWRNVVLNYLVWVAAFLLFCALLYGGNRWRALFCQPQE